MENLKLTFEATIHDCQESFVIDLPYQHGIVATNRFCPVDLLSPNINLLAAVKGETLDSFMLRCRRFCIAIDMLKEDSKFDILIGALMATVISKISESGTITISELLSDLDCFALFLSASGYPETEIPDVYRHTLQAIISIYPTQILSDKEG